MPGKFISSLLVILFPAVLFAQHATLKGKVSDAHTKEALAGAYVHLDDTRTTVVTDANGYYTIADLLPGRYKIKIKFIGYDEFEKSVTVNSSQTLTLDIPLQTNSKTLRAVSVNGKLDKETDAASRSDEKNSDNIKNVIGAQAIAKSPDINAANILQRLSGVTIQRNGAGDDSYAIIRGLEPKYNNTLVNGVKIASPDSKSRLVSLGVVPAELLSRIEVSKSLLPEMEGDAIGGTINLVFKDAPEVRELSATGALGYSQIFIDRKFLKFSSTDVQKKSPSERNGANYVAQPGDFSRSNLDFKPVTPPPTGTLSVAYGERFLKNKLGFLIGDSYQNLHFGSDAEINSGNADPNDPDHRPRINDIITQSFSTRQLLNNLIVHLDYNINAKNKITLDNILLYAHLEESAVGRDTSITGGNGGRTIPGTGPVNTAYRSTTTNQIIETVKLAGNHILSKHFLFDWTGVISDATRKTPDQAQINTNNLTSYDPSSKQTTTSPDYFDTIDRLWQHNQDKDYSGGGNLTFNTTKGRMQLELKGGGLYRHKTRFNYEDDYTLRPVATSNGGKPTFTNIYNAQWNVYNPYGAGTYNLNNYTITENITAYFGQFKVMLPKIDILGGIRSESTSQVVYIRTDPTNPSNATKSYADILPSLQIKYLLNDKTNLRFSYFASIARPAFYDIAPVSPPSTGGIAYKGNPAIKHTTANNYDIRYEFFPKEEEQFFIGVYFKDLTNPIEYSIAGNSGPNTYLQPINSDNAKVAGAEFTFMKFIGNIGVSGNYAYNYSDVNSVKIDRNNPAARVYEHRMLTGASVHDLNFSLLYRNKRSKINGQIAYQFLGKTLTGIYPNNGDDYIQKAMSFLAASGDAPINKHFIVFIKLNNLLNTKTVVVLHDFNNGYNATGASYLAGIRYKY